MAETNTTTPAQQVGPAVNGNTAPLAKAEAPVAGDLLPSAGAQVITWTRERVDLIKRQICPRGITDDEFAIFIEQCKRTALDPLIKEAYCVPRRVKIEIPNPSGDRPIEQWITKHEFQPAEAGMASRADRFPDFRGIKAAAVYEKDQIEIDAAAGTVMHKYNPVAKDRGRLVGAWAIAYREGRQLPVEWVDFDEFKQTTREGKLTGQWGTKEEVMIVKCARAAAWRRAYPNVFGGLYIAEEHPPEEREINAAPASPEQEANNGKTRTDRVAAKVAAKVSQTSAQPAAAPAAAPAKAQTVDAPKGIAVFGGPEVKGKKLAEISTDVLQQLHTVGTEKIKEAPNASWAPGVRANLVEIEAEIEKRDQPPAAELPESERRREPGEDDAPF